MRLAKIAAALVPLGLVATTALAQLPGVPFYPATSGTGAAVSAEYGNLEGSGSTIGVTGGLGFSRFGIGVGIGRISNGSDEIALAVIGGMRLFGGGLMPLSIGVQAGANRVETATSVAGRTQAATALMAGVNARLNPPLFPLKPFAVAYYTFGDADEEVRVAIGANFNLLLGLGFHAAYDFGDSGSAWGVGAHFNLRLPIPMM